MMKEFLEEILALRNEIKAIGMSRFFKTEKGQYGEGDIFLGLTSAQVRALAKKYYKNITDKDIEKLLQNGHHEVRGCSLLMCVLKYQKGDIKQKTDIFNLYINNANYINNWDLVDITAPYLSGDYVYNYGDTKTLWQLAKSKHLWSERISVVSGFYFIRKNEFDYILKICEYFLTHKHNLIHKATGWMLREVGKRDVSLLEQFLDKNISKMPRTMLRYAIEKFPPDIRKQYLKK